MGVLISHKQFINFGVTKMKPQKSSKQPKGTLIDYVEFQTRVTRYRLRRLRQQIIDNTPSF